MISKLDLYILNSDNSVAPFPSEAEQIVLYDFAFEAQRMGAAPEITATIQADGSLEKHITTKVFCEYKGERYFLKNIPSSSKNNTDPRYTFDLTFVSERTILDNVYMIDAVQGNSNVDRYQSNSTIVVFTGTIVEMVARLNAALSYAEIDYSVVLDSGITSETKLVSFQDKYFTEALQEGFKIFGIPYYFVGKVVHFGWAQNTIPTLKYGEGLLSVSKSLRSDRIINRLTGTGSSENIPYYYPNPSPKGILSLHNPNGLDATIESQLKLSKIPDGGRLLYRVERDRVDFISQYAIYGTDADYEVNKQLGIKEGIWQRDAILKQVQYEDSLTSPLYLLHAACGMRIASPEPVDIKISIKVQIGLRTPNRANSVTGTGSAEDDYKNIQEDIFFNGASMYKFSPQYGGIYISDIAIDLDVIYEHSEISRDGFIYRCDFLIKNVPTDPSDRLFVFLIGNKAKYQSEYSVKFEFINQQIIKPAGWYIVDSLGNIGKSPIEAYDYGVNIPSVATEGDVISYNVVKKIPFATALMPPIYRDSYGIKRFYDAINGKYEGFIFENEYNPNERKEGIVSFPDIKPTIVGVTHNGERIDMFSAFAYDTTDSDETESKEEDSVDYVHPYFYAKLRKLDFNLFEQAIESGEMTIEMTSGHCGACKFVIAVDENTQRNLVMVDDDGNLIYDESTGRVKMAGDATGLDRQNDTRSYEVWVALKKDINTFGQVMPNVESNLYPSTEDTFVLTNILLPESYIVSAEKKLEEAIIKSLAENNSYKYDFNIDFSRIYLHQDKAIAKQITENSSLNLVYNNKEYLFYISSYTYRKQKDELLPQIEVSLETSFESAPSAFQQMISSIQESASRIVSVNESVTDARYLRKNVPDTARDVITFEKGLVFNGSVQTTDFVRGDFAGKGFAIYTDENGNRVIEADRAIFRQDVSFAEIVINQVKFQAGVNVFSSGGCVITNVEEVDDAYRCYYDNKFDTRYAGFVEGDQAQCRRFDENFGDNNDAVTKYYWRLVTNVGSNYIDLSMSDASGEGVPQIGDEIVQLGHRTDPARQTAIVIASTPTPAILQYVGINSFDLPDPVTKISPNNNVFTGKVHIGAGSTGIENLDGLPDAIADVIGDIEVGKYNLLRNSGFTGDYLSKQLTSDTTLNGDSQMFSPSLVHWTYENATTQASEVSASGVEVSIANGFISQSLMTRLIAGESYILSFKAKGTTLSYSVGDVSKTIALTSEYVRYVEQFDALGDSIVFNIFDADCVICEIQLERGTVASSWGYSMWDNTSELAKYQSLQYLVAALTNGSTTINGGLILSNLLALGNYVDGEMKQVTSGLNGTYNNDNDVAFWSGGDLEQAIATVAKIKSSPRYYPTDEEWANMAKFVVTHGGDAFMRGYIYALGGIFKGTVDIAGGKIRLDEDGSGSLANGGFSWNQYGIAKKTYPDMIEWIVFADVVGNDNVISLDKGGYISNVYDNYGRTYTLPEANVGLSLCFAPPKVVTRATYSITIYSNAPFRAFKKDDTDIYAGEMIVGNYMKINALTLDKPVVNMTYDGEYWQVDTQGTVGNTSGGDSTKNITIWN